MTIQNIVDSISEALFQEFGSDYEIYTEGVEQGLKEPCFLIRCLNLTRNVDLGIRHKRTNQFSIQYIPSELDAIAECVSVLERLFECLKNVTLHGKPLHGTDLNGEIKDGILNFTVNYNGFTVKEKEIYIMEELDIIQKRVNE